MDKVTNIKETGLEGTKLDFVQLHGVGFAPGTGAIAKELTISPNVTQLVLTSPTSITAEIKGRMFLIPLSAVNIARYAK